MKKYVLTILVFVYTVTAGILVADNALAVLAGEERPAILGRVLGIAKREDKRE